MGETVRMTDMQSLYSLWLQKTADFPDLQDELRRIEGNPDEIRDRFYRQLEFGTGGLRGVIGVGSNRMNVFTVNQVTQGLANFLNDRYANAAVVIAYDSRINSDVFARESAGVLAANGIKAFVFRALVPTPMLSFAVRALGCSAGIMMTASHNPSEYNGYKCYAPEGYQMTDEAAEKTYAYIQKVDVFDGVRRIDFEQGLKDGSIAYVEQSLEDAYFEAVLAQQMNPGVCAGAGLKVIYTPLNGTGNKPVREILRRIGIEQVRVVPEQELPDGRFPTCPYPNPEIRQAFEQALKLAADEPADLLLATDPDCDRVGIAVPDEGEYKLLTGNEVGALLAEYILASRREQGTLPPAPVVIKSFVTTDLVAAVAANYNAEVVNLLTGFKYIGETMTALENNGESERFIVGMEESYGYLVGMHARDKDAVVAAMLICEMAAYYKARGLNLYRAMRALYEKYGRYINTVLSFEFKGESGMKTMLRMMDDLRTAPPTQIGGLPVQAVSDYLAGTTTDTQTLVATAIALPKSNVLAYKLPDGNGLIIRPSGTEPKIKVYITACAPTDAQAESLAARMKTDAARLLGLGGE